jgi:hypothetical protein
MDEYRREEDHHSCRLRLFAAAGSGVMASILFLALYLTHTQFQWQAYSSFAGFCAFIARQLWRACSAADLRAAARDDKLYTLVCADEVTREIKTRHSLQ